MRPAKPPLPAAPVVETEQPAFASGPLPGPYWPGVPPPGSVGPVGPVPPGMTLGGGVACGLGFVPGRFVRGSGPVPSGFVPGVGVGVPGTVWRPFVHWLGMIVRYAALRATCCAAVASA